MTTGHPTYHLRLYIAGDAQNSREAMANLREICDKHLGGACTIDIVDVFQLPARAMEDGIFMTPTLVKLAPGVRRTIVGTLSDIGTVLHALELPARLP